MSSISRSTRNTVTTDEISGVCWILDLPPEILQMITDFLTVHDLISLSRTCRELHTLINDDSYWIHRIHSEFPRPIAQLYTFDLFQEPEHIQTNDEPRPSGFNHVRDNGEIDLLARNSATHYNDEAIERRHAKMYVSKEDFLSNVQYFQFTKPREDLEVPLMKLIYFYLIDRKRRAAVNMDVIHLNNSYLADSIDRDSLTGHIIQLRNVCWLEITGRFEQNIMPGKYEVIWRMKSHSNNALMWGETEFIVVPSHGKMLINRLRDSDFRNYILEHSNRWFSITMGQIIIYEPSLVLMGIRNWNDGSWKSGISWDCIELKLIP